MSVTGYKIEVEAMSWTFRPSDFSGFIKKAGALAAQGFYMKTDTVQLPGECDRQRADRLANELGRAEVEVRRLKRAAKPKRVRAKSKVK